MTFTKILFFLSIFIIFWAMIGYQASIILLGKIYKNRKNKKDYSKEPTVTIMVVAHNEEKVIYDKLSNLININYPKNKMEILIASDNSTDKTNHLVKEFIKEYPQFNIRLYEVLERKGKTNAQNEAQKTVSNEYLIMTDANSMFHEDAVKELIASFTSEDIAYVAGKLAIINKDVSEISESESNYWNIDLKIRDIESRIQTITAGNGAIYACRTKDYVDFDPIKSHDSNMPRYFVLKGRRAICNHDAIAYEKAGEVIEDEFKRKVRMSRRILKNILPDIRILNIFKYKWYSYFYFGHRSCRYMLWISHLLLLISNIFLLDDSIVYWIILIGQLIFYFLAFIKATTKIDNKYINLLYYYTMTIIAQWVGVYNILTGKVKPFWEKAESTR